MDKLKYINNYINNDGLDLDRIVDDYTPYVKTIINNTAKDSLSYEDKEESIEINRDFFEDFEIELLLNNMIKNFT